MTKNASSNSTARYYHTARTAHLERLDQMEPADFLYTKTRLDWDGELASSLPQVQHIGLAQLCWRIARGRYRLVEVPEPLAILLLPQLVAVSSILWIRKFLRRRPTALVTYAIENLDPIEKLATTIRIPTAIARVALRAAWGIVVPCIMRIAYGTEGAQETYRNALGERRWKRLSKDQTDQIFVALPRADSPRVEHKTASSACFLGTFERRKGIQELLDAWDDAAEEASILTIMGKGPLANDVEAFAHGRPNVNVLLDPPRTTIREVLRESKVLILLSKRTTRWREQVGLPIVEGLEQGCEIVTTAETGIASWLKANGHHVISDLSRRGEPQESIRAALESSRPASAILDSLPDSDSRIDADRWMMTGA